MQKTAPSTKRKKKKYAPYLHLKPIEDGEKYELYILSPVKKKEDLELRDFNCETENEGEPNQVNWIHFSFDVVKTKNDSSVRMAKKKFRFPKVQGSNRLDGVIVTILKKKRFCKMLFNDNDLSIEPSIKTNFPIALFAPYVYMSKNKSYKKIEPFVLIPIKGRYVPDEDEIATTGADRYSKININFSKNNTITYFEPTKSNKCNYEDRSGNGKFGVIVKYFLIGGGQIVNGTRKTVGNNKSADENIFPEDE